MLVVPFVPDLRPLNEDKSARPLPYAERRRFVPGECIMQHDAVLIWKRPGEYVRGRARAESRGDGRLNDQTIAA
jgi:hypothetical protein